MKLVATNVATLERHGRVIAPSYKSRRRPAQTRKRDIAVVAEYQASLAPSRAQPTRRLRPRAVRSARAHAPDAKWLRLAGRDTVRANLGGKGATLGCRWRFHRRPQPESERSPCQRRSTSPARRCPFRASTWWFTIRSTGLGTRSRA